MQELAFGCSQLAALMRWRALIEHPAKGNVLIGRHRAAGGDRDTCVCWRKSFTLSPLCSQKGERRQKLQCFVSRTTSTGTLLLPTSLKKSGLLLPESPTCRPGCVSLSRPKWHLRCLSGASQLVWAKCHQTGAKGLKASRA